MYDNYTRWLVDMTELEKEKCCECGTVGDSENELRVSHWHGNGRQMLCDKCWDSFIQSEIDEQEPIAASQSEQNFLTEET